MQKYEIRYINSEDEFVVFEDMAADYCQAKKLAKAKSDYKQIVYVRSFNQW